ncbi:DUF6691 family protein [Hyphomicrobium sp.]|jgi:uncharacterized membrane protein YedE/YeeE|uniref:DUF6691 family protein n=1 Tax=Hyphomicrobium sp. TaxID=82 RepID=UPI002BED4652|nr:DUF6691 family protein [Hyphomicrobium sp.]HVZ04076.1 DUF6691 family protein [Hyphomicrobium sp.]
MAVATTFIAGLLFGLGLVVSGLANPEKVQAFLDVAGHWDASLAVTMAVAVAITAAGYRAAFVRGKPWLSAGFQMPRSKAIDAPLIGGAVIFGIGWGLSGFCPGPAIVAAALGLTPAVVFVGAMLVGMMIARLFASRSSTAAKSAANTA